MKKISVLGLEFMDYSVKEAMRMVSSFFENSRVDTVCFLSMKSIMDASSNPDLKGWLESMDLLVPVSAEILEAAGTMSRQRTREVQEGKFYSELMNKLSNDKCTIFILADNMDDIEASKGYLRRRSKGASVVGCFAYEEVVGADDNVVNEINSTFPDVVISRMSSPKQEQFIYENRDKINAKMLIALKNKFNPEESFRSSKFHSLGEKIHKTVFKHKVSRYENSQDGKE